MQPTLTSARLRLRPASEDDLDALWALWTEPQVRRFLWDDVVIERDHARQTLRDFVRLAPRGLGLWAIAVRDAGDLVGCAGLSPVGVAAEYFPPFAGAVEPIVALEPRCWSRGYAVEALATLIAYARDDLKLDALVGVTDVPNVASDRLLRRVGFVPCAETNGPRERLRHYRLAPRP